MVILKGIPRIINPSLLSVLARMGHGDEIVLADANFPSASICRHGPELIRADGHAIPPLLKAITSLLPLDTYVPRPAMLMELVHNDKKAGLKTPIWEQYKSILQQVSYIGHNLHKIFIFLHGVKCN
uniref:L-fucose mutarotase n=1 Tax=Amphimedon queenslandica TaxID=400682 RepID=A0A1X7V5J2_AMPQE